MADDFIHIQAGGVSTWKARIVRVGVGFIQLTQYLLIVHLQVGCGSAMIAACCGKGTQGHDSSSR